MLSALLLLGASVRSNTAPDPGTRWALYFSAGQSPAKVSAQDLFGTAPRGLARQHVPQTPGFEYTPCDAEEGAIQQCAASSAVGAGFGVGWFVSMGAGRDGAQNVAPLTRYSNESVSEDAGELTAAASPLVSGVRSSTVFAHVRGGGALAMASPANAPPFLLRADPTQTTAAHRAVQHKGVPTLMWMHCGQLPNFHSLRPLLLNKVGPERTQLITGQSESEHVAALFTTLLVANRSKLCVAPEGEELPASDRLHCEQTGWRW